VRISDSWLREHWGRAFEVVEIAPRIHNSSWALLRKREVTLTVDGVAHPGDDWREYQAVRHNLLRAQREIEHAEARLAAAQREAAEQLAAVRRSYEQLRSWRLTRPLREFARYAGGGQPTTLRGRRAKHERSRAPLALTLDASVSAVDRDTPATDDQQKHCLAGHVASDE
jgi:hypothetical protein